MSSYPYYLFAASASHLTQIMPIWSLTSLAGAATFKIEADLSADFASPVFVWLVPLHSTKTGSAVYTREVAEKISHLRPDERQQLEATLNAVDEEEARGARLLTDGKISEDIWDSLWREWQDRRNRIRSSLATLEQLHQTHIDNLDIALKMISRVGIVYNSLERSDQKELLRHVVSRVVIDNEGIINLERRAPFSYLQDIRNWIGDSGEAEEIQFYSKNKNSEVGFAVFI